MVVHTESVACRWLENVYCARAESRIAVLILHLVTGLAGMSCYRVTDCVVSQDEATSDMMNFMYSNVRVACGA
jgi:hypothetical protein